MVRPRLKILEWADLLKDEGLQLSDEELNFPRLLLVTFNAGENILRFGCIPRVLKNVH